MIPAVISRLAPTPSGYLHIGNAYNFLVNWLTARSSGGLVFLRIDDLDAARVRNEYIEDIFRTLEWLGIDWDIGPNDVQDFKKNWSQTLRISDYENTLSQLAEKQLLFGCACSRKILGNAEVYPGYCLDKNFPLDTKEIAWRIHIEENTTVSIHDEALNRVDFDIHQLLGSAVVRRRDGVPAYHIASLTDDINFGINFIARGIDLLPSTALQLHLAGQLNNESFLKTKFLHHELLSNTDGTKLSKSSNDTSLKYIRENGMKASALLQSFAAWKSLKISGNIPSAYHLLSFWDGTYLHKV